LPARVPRSRARLHPDAARPPRRPARWPHGGVRRDPGGGPGDGAMRTRRLVAFGLGLAVLAGCGRASDPGNATAAIAPHGLTAAQLSFLKFSQVAEVEASSVANLNGAIDFDEQRTARLNAAVPGRVAELLVQVGDHVEAEQPLVGLESAD